MRLIENQHGAGRERPKPVAKRSGVGLVDQQPVGNQKTRMSSLGIDAETSFAANLGNEVFVEDFEVEAKALLEFFLPLEQHRRRAGYNDFAHLLAHQQLSRNQARLNGLAQANVIGNKQIDAW
jgi:hypothetical protein